MIKTIKKNLTTYSQIIEDIPELNISIRTEHNKSNNAYYVFLVHGNNEVIIRYYETYREYKPFDLKSLHQIYVSHFKSLLDNDISMSSQFKFITNKLFEDIKTESVKLKRQPFIVYTKDGVSLSTSSFVEAIDLTYYGNLYREYLGIEQSNTPIFF